MDKLLGLLATANVEKLLSKTFAAAMCILMLWMGYHFADRMMTSQEGFNGKIINTQQQQSETLNQMGVTVKHTDDTLTEHTSELREIKQRLPREK